MAISPRTVQGVSPAKEAPDLQVAMLSTGWGMKESKGFFGGKKSKEVGLDAILSSVR